jgi:hypothetical protein
VKSDARSLALTQLLRSPSIPPLELPRPQPELEHLIDLRHAPSLHLRNQPPRHHRTCQTSRQISESSLAPEVALVRVKHVGESETRHSRSERRDAPAETLGAGAELEGGGFGGDGEGGGPDAYAGDDDG